MAIIEQKKAIKATTVAKTKPMQLEKKAMIMAMVDRADVSKRKGVDWNSPVAIGCMTNP